MMPNFPLDPLFTGDATRAAFPRQLIIYDMHRNEWYPCIDEEILASIDYLAVSYRQIDFPDKVKLEESIRSACDTLNFNAYWLDIACTGVAIGEKNRDLFRIADVFRGAKKTLVLISGNERRPRSPGWLSWGNRLWTLPEALLSQSLLLKVGSRRIEEISLRQLANHAYKDREEEMMLIDGYSGKDPLPLSERTELLLKALWKRSSGHSLESHYQTESIFEKYAAERVYALMGFMQYRIMPDYDESEENALKRLLTVNKLDYGQFSWYKSIITEAEITTSSPPSTWLSSPSQLNSSLRPIRQESEWNRSGVKVGTHQLSGAENSSKRELFSRRESYRSGSSSNIPDAKPKPVVVEGNYVVALYDFDASEINELSFKDGDRIIITQIASEDWWQGKDKDGRLGLFPANYVRLPEKYEDSLSAVALYDFIAGEDNEISFEEGETIIHVRAISEDWWHGKNKRGLFGLFPANRVKVVGNYESDVQAIARYDYSAGEDNEISFEEGDVITNIVIISENWWEGRDKDGKIGVFPANHVEIL